MNSKELRPEIRKIVKLTPRLPWSKWFKISRLLYDIGAQTKLAKGVNVSRVVENGVDLLVYSPKSKAPKGAILWIFGGGHWAGKPAHLNSIASKVVNELGVEVFVPKYRLAPRHPFPANLDDCFRAWHWLIAHVDKRGLDLEKLAIAGHSAGGGLAAALVQRIYDEGGVQPKVQCLFYPMVDDRIAINRALDKKNHFIWNNKVNYDAWKAYLKPHLPGQASLPAYAAAARREDLSGLPPAWIGQCGLDLFFDQYTTYAERLNDAGVKCETYLVEGVPHAFEVLAPKKEISQQFEADAIRFLGKVFNE
ncbi:MAG TPA: alpha/beta hydrolase [Microscillaceae bacterium]|nr:alpha/beta hydrolase [Microscillaceae bacterium]